MSKVREKAIKLIEELSLNAQKVLNVWVGETPDGKGPKSWYICYSGKKDRKKMVRISDHPPNWNKILYFCEKENIVDIEMHIFLPKKKGAKNEKIQVNGETTPNEDITNNNDAGNPESN